MVGWIPFQNAYGTWYAYVKGSQRACVPLEDAWAAFDEKFRAQHYA